MRPHANEDRCVDCAHAKPSLLGWVLSEAMTYTGQAIFATSGAISGRPLPQGLRIV